MDGNGRVLIMRSWLAKSLLLLLTTYYYWYCYLSSFCSTSFFFSLFSFSVFFERDNMRRSGRVALVYIRREQGQGCSLACYYCWWWWCCCYGVLSSPSAVFGFGFVLVFICLSVCLSVWQDDDDVCVFIGVWGWDIPCVMLCYVNAPGWLVGLVRRL